MTARLDQLRWEGEQAVFAMPPDIDITNAGVSVAEAQANWFATDWLTVVIGRYITPIGFFNERLNHEWINRLPDPPLPARLGEGP